MKKIILGIIALSSVAMAAQDNTSSTTAQTQSKFSNRFGFSYVANGSEEWKKDDIGIDTFRESYEIDYKLLYNVTDKFRWGGELGLDISPFSDDFKNNSKGVNNANGALLLGVTGEYDVYSFESAAIYLNGSIGGAGGKTEIKDEHGTQRASISATSYLKVGIGSRFNNGLGLELGRRFVGYKFESDTSDDSNTMSRGQTYVQLNYTF